MGIKDAVPNRPLYEEEFETLIEDLPDGYRPIPGSAVDTGTGELLMPTFAVKDPNDTVTLFGHSMKAEEWMTIETWEDEEYDPDEQAERLSEWGEKHLPNFDIKSGAGF